MIESATLAQADHGSTGIFIVVAIVVVLFLLSMVLVFFA